MSYLHALVILLAICLGAAAHQIGETLPQVVYPVGAVLYQMTGAP